MQKQMNNRISVILANECVIRGIWNSFDPVEFVVLQMRGPGMFLSGYGMS